MAITVSKIPQNTKLQTHTKQKFNRQVLNFSIKYQLRDRCVTSQNKHNIVEAFILGFTTFADTSSFSFKLFCNKFQVVQKTQKPFSPILALASGVENLKKSKECNKYCPGLFCVKTHQWGVLVHCISVTVLML